MPTIRPIDASQADPNTARTLNAVKNALGVLPNMVLTMANAPSVLQAYVQFSGATAGGKLDAKRRESIALAVAQENACGYCLAAHSVIGRGHGLSQAQIDAARAATAENPADAAIVTLARRIAQTRGNLSPSDVAAFRAHGFGDAELLEVIANVALNIFTNYVNHIAGTEIDFPVVDLKLAA